MNRTRPDNVLGNTPRLRGNAALTGVSVVNDGRLTAYRRDLRNLTPEQLATRRGDFADFRERARGGADTRAEFRQTYQDLPLASVYFRHTDPAAPRPRNYDQIINEPNEYWTLAQIMSGRLSTARQQQFTNPPIMNGRYRIEIEYAGVDGVRSFTITITIPNFRNHIELERFVYDQDQLFWVTRETSDEMLDVYSIRIFPVIQFTGGRAPRLNRLLDGPVHCFFAPIIRKLELKIRESTGERTVQRYESLKREALKLIEEFKDGVSVNNFSQISSRLNCSITVKDIFQEILFTNVGEKVRYLAFTFVYHDSEHVSMENDDTVWHILEKVLRDGYDPMSHKVSLEVIPAKSYTYEPRIDDAKEVIEVTHKQMNDIYDFAVDNRLYTKFTGNRTTFVKKMYLAGKVFVVKKLPHEEIEKRFFEGIKNFQFNFDFENPASPFVEAAYIQKVQFALQENPESCEDLVEFDKIKAYANFKSCPYYIGFPSVLHHTMSLLGHSFGRVKDFVVKNPGFYQVRITSISKHPDYLEKWGIKVGNLHVFTSPMICWLIDLGCVMTLVSGTWSTIPTDITFEDDIVQGKVIDAKTGEPTKISIYAHIVGIMGSSQHLNFESFTTSNKFVDDVTDKEGKFVDFQSVTEDYGIMTATTHKKFKRNFKPLAAYILSYVFIDVMSEVIKFPIDDVFAVKVDSILMRKGNQIDNPHFREKTPKTLFGKAPIYDGYFPTTSIVARTFEKMPIQEQYIIGPGGSGKTYHFLYAEVQDVASKYMDPVYVTPQNLLKQNQAVSFEKHKTERLAFLANMRFKIALSPTSHFDEEDTREAIEKVFGWTVSSHALDQALMRISSSSAPEPSLENREAALQIVDYLYSQVSKQKFYATSSTALLEKPVPRPKKNPETGKWERKMVPAKRYNPGFVPGCIILDEATMYDANDIKKAKELYPFSKIYVLGDFMKDNNPLLSYQAILPSLNPINVQEYHEFTEDRRSITGDPLIEFKKQLRAAMSNTTELQMWFRRVFEKLPFINETDVDSQYTHGDACIAYTHDTCDRITGLIKNKPDVFRIQNGTTNSVTKVEYFTGDIVYSAEGFPPKSIKKTYCFTAHSLQGQTVDPPRKIFIAEECKKDPRVLYTAISRARRFDQLVFVKSPVRLVGQKSARPDC
jgi:hypothetical protein